MTLNHLTTTGGLVAAASFICTAAPAGALDYEVHEIAHGASSTVAAMNGAGVVVGRSADGTLFRWTLAEGAAPLDGLPEATAFTAHDVNGPGDLTGVAMLADGGNVAFLHAADQMISLGLEDDWVTRTLINDAALLIANVTDPATNSDFILRRVDDAWIDLASGVPGSVYGYGEAVAINEAGQMVGHAPFIYVDPEDEHTTHAIFRWEPDGTFTVIGPLGGEWPFAGIFAAAMNAQGQITGRTSHPGASSSFDRIAFRYSDGEGLVGLQTLTGAVESEGQAINEAGDVAGVWRDATDAERFFLYSDDLGMIDLGLEREGDHVIGINGDPQVLLSSGRFWSSATGAIDLQDVVTPDGLDIGELLVTGAVAIAEDGTILLNAAPFTYPPGPPVGLLLKPAGPAADLDGDGSVTVDDLLIVITSWGACPPPPATCAADLDGNGAVDVEDLIAVLTSWTP